MADERRRLPIVTGGAPPGPEAEPARSWHWVPISAVVAVGLSTALCLVLLPSLLNVSLEDLPAAQAEALVIRMVASAGAIFALSAFAAGFVVGRFKSGPGPIEAPIGMALAALVFALLARQIFAIVWLGPPMALCAWAGARLGRRSRARSLSPRPQPPPR